MNVRSGAISDETDVSSRELGARLRAVATEAVRYWEKMRIVYNLVLAAELAAIILFSGELQNIQWSVQLWMGLFVLAVGANVVYCAAYPVEFLMGISDFWEQWRKIRVTLFLLGTLVAGVLTYQICAPLFFMPAD